MIDTTWVAGREGGKMKNKLDAVLNKIQLYSYLLPTVKIGNAIMDFREKYTLLDCKKERCRRDD